MPISPQGSTNLAALNVPNVYVQIVPPNPLLNGIATDISAVVGSAQWGAVNSPVRFGGMQGLISSFGSPLTDKYDLGTVVETAIDQGASNFICVRVTDGTDTASSVALLDDSVNPTIGAYLTGIYTGTLGNSINAVITLGTSYTNISPSYKLTVYFNGGIPEVFDNISNVNDDFWQNLVTAVNEGQSIARGPSQIVIATLSTGISSVSIVNPGSYVSNPTVTVNSGTGSGASLQSVLGALSASVVSGGTGYAVDDEITLTGGTLNAGGLNVTLKVTAVNVDAVDTVDIVEVGQYINVPASPVSQGSSTGLGTGATFTMDWSLVAIKVLDGGTGYLVTDSILISDSGGGSATINIGSSSSPLLTSYTLSGGTNGNGALTDADLIGSDVTPRTGMYALRGSEASQMALAGADDSTYWTDQDAFGMSEAIYMIGTLPPGYQDDISGAVDLLRGTGIDSYQFKLQQGDWVQINDTFNSVNRYVSPQGFVLGILATQLPSNSTLNKKMSGILSTQKSSENRIYSDSDLSQLKNGRIDVITKPLPAGEIFGERLGINTSSNPLTNTDNYPRMVNFIGKTILKGMGQFVGQPQTDTLRTQARSVIQSYLGNLFNLNMIGDVNAPGDPARAFKVILNESNNPPDRVALGYMQCDVQVVLYAIVLYLVVNLSAEQGGTIQVIQQNQIGA